MGIKAITKTELERLNRTKGKFRKILDVGCGGQINRSFIDFDEYIGIDVMKSGHPQDQKKLISISMALIFLTTMKNLI